MLQLICPKPHGALRKAVAATVTAALFGASHFVCPTDAHNLLGFGASKAFASGLSRPAETSGAAANDDMGKRIHVYLDDLPVEFPIDPFLLDSTAMVPLRALSEALGFKVTWNGGSDAVTCVKDATEIRLTLGNRIAYVNGKERELPQPPALAKNHTAIPLRFFSEAMGFPVKWDSETSSAWVTSPKSKMPVWGFYALGSPEYSSWDDFFGDKYPFPLEPGPAAPASRTAGAILGWFAVDKEGRVTTDDRSSDYRRPDGWEAVMMRLKMSGSKAVAMFFADNKDGRLSALLDSPVRRQDLAMSVASSAACFDGAALDFEGLGLEPERAAKDASNYTAFIDALTVCLRGRPLTVVLHPLNGSYAGYDHAAIGKRAESVILMAYEYEDPFRPTATAPWQAVEEAIRLELENVPASKIVLGIPAYGTVYSATPAGAKRESRPAAKDQSTGAVKVYDPYSACDYSTWKDGETTYHAFTESNRSLAARVALAKRHGLAGVAIWRLGLLQNGWLDVLTSVADPTR